MRKIFLFLILPLFLTSCSNTIDGNSDDVKSLAVSLVTSEMKNQAVPVLIMQFTSVRLRIP